MSDGQKQTNSGENALPGNDFSGTGNKFDYIFAALTNRQGAMDTLPYAAKLFDPDKDAEALARICYTGLAKENPYVLDITETLVNDSYLGTSFREAMIGELSAPINIVWYKEKQSIAEKETAFRMGATSEKLSSLFKDAVHHIAQRYIDLGENRNFAIEDTATKVRYPERYVEEIAAGYLNYASHSKRSLDHAWGMFHYMNGQGFSKAVKHGLDCNNEKAIDALLSDPIASRLKKYANYLVENGSPKMVEKFKDKLADNIYGKNERLDLKYINYSFANIALQNDALRNTALDAINKYIEEGGAKRNYFRSQDRSFINFIKQLDALGEHDILRHIAKGINASGCLYGRRFKETPTLKLLRDLCPPDAPIVSAEVEGMHNT